VCCSVLQCGAVCCRWCVATCCSVVCCCYIVAADPRALVYHVLQLRSGILQCVVMCCSALQRVAV